MADGAVLIDVNMNVSKAEKDLAKLRRDIEKTAKSIESTGGKKDVITRQLEDARAAAQQTAAEIEKVNASLSENQKRLAGESIARRNDMAYMPVEDYQALKQTVADQVRLRDSLTDTQAKQQAEVAKLEGQEQKVLATLKQQTEQLEQQKEEAGAIERVMAEQGANALPKIRDAVENASKSFKSGLKNILKWGLGIRSVFILVRRLRSAITEGVQAFAEQDPETRAFLDGLKASLTGLKASWGAAFAPIVNAVAPLLQRLIGWLISAANSVQMFFAVLNGKGSYKKVIANNNALANSYSGAGGAAKEAARQLLAFDEINKRNEESSGGGGGGGSGIDAVEEAIDTQSMPARFAMAFKDVVFDWHDLTPEQITEKALAGLTTLGGAITGGMIGGVPGAIIGALAGLALGIALDGTIFNLDGELQPKELGKTLLAVAGWATGMLIGFAAGGGPLGASLAATIGMLFAVDLANAIYEPNGTPKLPEMVRAVIVEVETILGAATLALGALFAFSGINIPLGIGMMVAGIGMEAHAFINFDSLSDKVKEALNEITIAVGLSLIAIGAILALSSPAGFRIGIGMIMAGVTATAVATLNWRAMPDQIRKTASTILGIVGGALLVLGAIFTFSGANPVVGIGLMLAGAASLASAAAIDTEGFIHMIANVVASIMAILGGALIVLGILLCLSGAGIGLGLAVLAAGLAMSYAAWSLADNPITSFVKGLADSIVGVVDWAFNAIASIVTSAWESIKNLWNSLFGEGGVVDKVIDRGNNYDIWSDPNAWSGMNFATGGVITRPSRIIAGEDGREAIVPLEHNTEWIGMVARGMVDQLLANRQVADYVSMLPMPALASGQIVPPQALNGGGSYLSDSDIDRLVSGITAAFGGFGNSDGDHVTKVYLDGREMAEVVSRHQRRMDKERGN